MLQFLYVLHQLYNYALKLWSVDFRESVLDHRGVHKLSPLIGMKAHVLHLQDLLKSGSLQIARLTLFQCSQARSAYC